MKPVKIELVNTDSGELLMFVNGTFKNTYYLDNYPTDSIPSELEESIAEEFYS